MQHAWSTAEPDIQAWLTPVHSGSQDLRYQEKTHFVDYVSEFVPYWIKGVEAAERGETWKLEDFLESQAHSHRDAVGPTASDGAAWSNKGSGNKHLVGQETDFNWTPVSNVDDWSTPVPPPRQVSPRRHRRRRSTADDAHGLVEDVTRRKSVNQQRKRDLHSFAELPTQEKLKKIDALIRDMHSS